MNSFAERLQHSRKAKLLSQSDLAQLMNKSGKAVISNWEIGKAEPSLSDLRRLAEVLGTTSCWLVDGIEVGESRIINEPLPGYTMIPAQEIIDLQRQLLACQSQLMALKAKD